MSVMPVPEPALRTRRAPRFAGLVAWLDAHRTPVIALAVATMAGALLMDVAFPSYPIMGFYLVPITLAALTMRVRITLGVSLTCLALGLYVMVLQDRVDGPNITVVCFCVVSAVTLIALAYLVRQVGRLYETEHVTTERLASLATQLQTLQEVVVLDTDRPLSDLLRRVIEQASQLLGSDGCCVYRLDDDEAALTAAASTGMSPRMGDTIELPLPAARPAPRRLPEQPAAAAASALPVGKLSGLPS